MSAPGAERGVAAAAIVAEILRAALALERCLEEERQALEQQHADAIAAASGAKHGCVQALEQVEQRRQHLCKEAGHPAQPADMPAFLSWCGAPARARDEWQRILETVARAARLNAANGAVIHLRREQLAAALSIVSGARGESAGTYGPAGEPWRGVTRRALAEA